jgi:BASS family bile acid:Na+ symporter
MLEQSIPILVFLLMFIVGASLTFFDIKTLFKRPIVLLIATLGQVFLLPCLAWVLIELTQPPPVTAVGLLLVSCCPGGSISNIYSYFAKVNVAFSVALTALNSFFSLILLPLLLSQLFPSLLKIDNDLLVQTQTLNLLLLLILPMMLGMALSGFNPFLMQKALPIFDRIAAIGLILLLLAIGLEFKDQLIAQFFDLLSLAVLFTLLALCVAYLFARLLGLSKGERGALLIEFPVRNLALTALISLSIFDSKEYILFGAVFFLVQIPIMLFIAYWYRRHNVNNVQLS